MTFTALLKRPCTLELLITGLLSCIVPVFFTIPYDNYDSFAINAISGQFSDFAFCDNFWLGLLWVSSIYKSMQIHFPALNWMGIFFLGLTIISLYILLRAVRYILDINSFGLGLIVAIELFFAGLFLENLIMLTNTRFSLLFCGIGLFNLLVRKRLSKIQFILYNLIFILGLLHRPESAVGMLVLTTMFFFIYHFNIRYYIRRMWFPVLFTCSILAFISIDWMTTNEFVKKVEPEIEYKLMARRVVDISTMHTALDSVKYQAGTSAMWFDFKTLNPTYLRSILLAGSDVSYTHIFEVLKHVFSFYRFFENIWAISAFLLFSILFYAERKTMVLRIILFQTGTFILIFCLDFNGFLVDHRHFLNIQLIALLLSLSFFAEAGFSFGQPLFSKKVIWMLFLPVFFTTIYSAKEIKINNIQIVTDVHCLEATMNQLESTYTNRTIILTVSNWCLTNHTFSIFINNYAKNRYVLYDMFTHSSKPRYVVYQSHICKCDATDPVLFFRWLSAEKALYIADPDWYKLTERYMNLVHGINLKFISDKAFSKPDCLAVHQYKDMDVRLVKVSD